jgi:hypothetical protein
MSVALMRPIPLFRNRLGQATPGAVTVWVYDHRGRPIPKMLVYSDVRGTDASALTDDAGKAVLDLPTGKGNVYVGTEFKYAVPVEVPSKGDVFVTLPMCLSQPIINGPELATLLVGAAITAAGYYWKLEPAKVAGEVLVGASIFTTIYRLSCL